MDNKSEEDTSLIAAGDLVLKVIEDWGVKNIYGLPGGSFDSMMNALHDERDHINFVQVRHEEAGAIAASAEAKLTGRIGVCFGSAGPGAIHLLNGLYDARADNVPVLAIVGQVPTSLMNIDYFQAMDEEPAFADVAQFNRTATTAEGLPDLIDRAIREAYKNRGPSVITIPKDLAWTKISNKITTSAHNFKAPLYPLPDPDLIAKAYDLIKNAKAPLIYFGMGARRARNELIELSEKFKMPLVSTHPSKGTIEDDYYAFLGSAGRVATKPASDANYNADVVLWIGNDIPFGRKMVLPTAKIIQVDINSANLGKRRPATVAILADSKQTLRALIDHGEELPDTPYYRACLANKKNWESWIASFNEDTSTPMRPEPIFNIINQQTDDHDIFLVDVGNVNINFARLAHLKPTNKWCTSGKYATMGFAVPASLAAQLEYPESHVYSLSGDGGFAMLSEELITQVRYHLPVINVVFSNRTLGFIEAEQRDDTHQPLFGVALPDTDWATVAQGYGALGFTVHTLEEAKIAFAEAKSVKFPSVIDIKLTGDMPLTTLYMHLSDKDDPILVREYKDKYQAHALKAFDYFLEQEQHIE